MQTPCPCPCTHPTGTCEACAKVAAALTPERVEEILRQCAAHLPGLEISEVFARAISREVVRILAVDDGWRDIATAPVSGLVLLEVEHGGERRVFAAEQSSSEAGRHWVITTGWIGWTRLNGSWRPTRWKPLPAPPASTGETKE